MIFHIVLIWQFDKIRSTHRRCSVKKSVLRNFAKVTGKYLCQSLFFNKVAGLACNFIKKESLAQVFSCEFCEISENTFFHRRPLAAASEISDIDFHSKKKLNFFCISLVILAMMVGSEWTLDPLYFF